MGLLMMTSFHELCRAGAGSPTAAADYNHRVKTACDELHDHPTNPAAPEAMLELLKDTPPVLSCDRGSGDRDAGYRLSRRH